MSLCTFGIVRIGALVIGLLGTAFVSKGMADCGSKGTADTAIAVPQSWQEEAGNRPSLSLVSSDSREVDRIVGFWRVKLISEGTPGIPDGTLFDDSYAQWHADGTEVTISIFAPATGNICFGVWEKVGPSAYTLNHFGLGFDANGTFTGQAQIREHVVVDRRGNRFEGTFSVDSYDLAGNLVARIVGRVLGTRVTVQTTIQQVL